MLPKSPTPSYTNTDNCDKGYRAVWVVSHDSTDTDDSFLEDGMSKEFWSVAYHF